MRDVFLMWRSKRMVALTVFVTVAYSFALLPFKSIPIIDGYLSIRPANVLPVVFGLLFGPAAAWGSMFGNIVGDAVGGTWSDTSYFGAVGNFVAAFVTYRLWGNIGGLSDGYEPDLRSGGVFAEYLVIALVSAAATASVIGWGHEVISRLTFTSVGIVIFLNNSLTAVLLGPPVLYLAYPEVKKRGWLYHQILSDSDLSRRSERRMRIAALGISVVSVVWLTVGIVLGFLVHGPPPVLAGGEPAIGGSWIEIMVGGLGFAVFLLLCLLSGERLSVMDERRN